ncbi:MAG TPA: ABC transporter ATP-binding protein [Candidatus Binataceae bacterium]
MSASPDIAARPAPALAAPPAELAFPIPSRLKSRDVFRLLTRVWPFVRPYRRHLVYLFALMIPSLPAGLFGLTMIRIFFDVIGHGAPLKPYEAWMLGLTVAAPRELVLWRAGVLTGIVSLILLPLGFLTLAYAVWILQRISNLFRVNLYTRLQELSLRFHSEEKIGDAIFRMFQDSAAIPQVIAGLVIQPLRFVPFLIANLVWLFIFDASIALIALALLPLNLLMAWAFSDPLRRAFVAEREASANATTRIEETLASIKTVKAFGTEASESAVYARDNWDAFRASRRARLMLAAYRVLSNTIRGFAYVAALYFGARQVLHGGSAGLARAAVSLGLFQGELAVFGAMAARTRAVTDLWGSMQDVVVAIARVLEMLAKPAEEQVDAGVRIPRSGSAALKFDKVSFGYEPGAPILSEVSFEARPGEITAIAGPSGAGKSTIIALVVRFFDSNAGRIMFGADDVRALDLAAWRGELSVALQDNPLFTASIRDNVAYGRPDASLADVAAAVERAGLGEFVRSLPAGLATVLGEKGAKLSAGQAQRIGLARALLRDARILLLDEPTSALDAATENTIMRGIRAWVNEQPSSRLAIVATHRRTTAAHADRQYQIASGRLAIADDSALAPAAVAATRNGYEAQRSPIVERANAQVAPTDSRVNLLYDDERATLRPREALGLIIWSWPFIAAHRRLVASKCALAFVSLTFFLMTPWPVKIVIDNVIDGRPLTGVSAWLLRPLVGDDRALLLAVVSGFLFFTAILIGMVGTDAPGLGTNVNSGGLDQAGMTANDANDGWSLWNGLFGFWEATVTLDLTQRINQTVRTAIYERFLRSPLGLYADQKIGDAVFRVMYDSASIGDVLYRAVLAPLMSIVLFVLTIAVLRAQFSNEPMIPILAALVLPVVAIGASLFGRLLRSQSQQMRERGSDVMAAFEERVAQVQLIKAFGQEARESAAIDAASWESYRSTLRMIGILLVIGLVLIPVIGLLIAVSIYYLMMQVIEGRITLGDLVLLLSYAALLSNPMATLGATWAAMQLPIAGLRRIHSVLETLAEPSAASNGTDLGAPVTRLEFRDVAVGYDSGAPVLEHVSLRLRAGEMAAIAGPSGCGKTTLIYSLPGFIELSAGTILVNGTDLAGWHGALRERIAFVFQQEALFSATIAENIRYGSPRASDAQVREAAAMADAAEFVERLPNGYATMLGRRGARLSVGQKQRIAIARALLRNPEVLVLDEPTAPLDPATEAELIRTLRALAQNRIVLLVAHRAGTLGACDRVFFLHDRTIVASGTHAELLASCPTYQAYQAVTDSEIEA